MMPNTWLPASAVEASVQGTSLCAVFDNHLSLQAGLRARTPTTPKALDLLLT